MSPFNTLVAPHAGAWIETDYTMLFREHPHVAPHAGAWIETQFCLFKIFISMVAPHAGAWIETKNWKRIGIVR